MSGKRKYRSTVTIFKEILEVIYRNREASISKISVEANIPHSRLKGLLERMVSAGIVREMENGNRRTYTLTEKGRKMLIMLDEVQSFLSTLGLI